MTIDLILSLVSAGGFTLAFLPFIADRYLSYGEAGREGTLFIRPRPWERSLGLGIVYRHAYLRGVRKDALRVGNALRDKPNREGLAHVYLELGDSEAHETYVNAFEKRRNR